LAGGSAEAGAVGAAPVVAGMVAGVGSGGGSEQAVARPATSTSGTILVAARKVSSKTRSYAKGDNALAGLHRTCVHSGGGIVDTGADRSRSSDAIGDDGTGVAVASVASGCGARRASCHP
jgi:hypothetical protein